MKFYILVLSLLLSTQSFYCQDSIFAKNGKFIFAKVTNVKSNEINYRINDSLYTLTKSDLIKIKYLNGTVGDFRDTIVIRRFKYTCGKEKYHRIEINRYMIKNSVNQPTIVSYAKKGKRSAFMAGFSGISTLALLGATEYLAFSTIPLSLSSTHRDAENLENVITGIKITGVGTLGAALSYLTFNHRHKKYTRKAVHLYNQRF